MLRGNSLIEHQEHEASGATAYYNILDAKTEKDIWKEELEEFRKCYIKNLAEYNELYEEERNRFTTQKKKVTKSRVSKK